MKQVLVECYPDGKLVSKLGINNKEISHYYGKSRVYTKLSRSSGCRAMVDEDPGVSIYPYEKELKLVDERYGIQLYSDRKRNKVIVLNIRLENWILSACKAQRTDPDKFSLPADPVNLHDTINQKLDKFGSLIDELLKKKNPAILQLKSWLQ